MSFKRKSLRAATLSVGVVAALSAGTGMSYAQASTSGHNGIGSGNQVAVPVTAPVNVCGNAVSVIGQALASCKGGAGVDLGGRHHRSGYAHPGSASTRAASGTSGIDLPLLPTLPIVGG